MLYKSKTNKRICGVCGGIGEYLNVDPALIRIILVLLFLYKGVGLLTYVIAAIIMNNNPYEY